MQRLLVLNPREELGSGEAGGVVGEVVPGGFVVDIDVFLDGLEFVVSVETAGGDGDHAVVGAKSPEESCAALRA